MADMAALQQLIEPEVEAEGFALVRVMMTGAGGDPVLQVMAERPDTGQLDLADCERLSRRLSNALDSADPIEHHYRLEVSSPGIDRPLTRPGDFETWKGHEARVRLEQKIGGRGDFRGTLRGLKDDEIRLDVDGLGEVRLPRANVRSAKLLLTDKLLAATAPLNPRGADTFEQELEQQE
ncbi:MAG: ribosome maturation protein RimP [Sphingosinicella sp.]